MAAADTVRGRPWPSSDSGNSPPPAGSGTRRRGAFARWGVALFFLAAAIYVLVRLVWISQHPWPNLILTEDLRVVFNRGNFGLTPEARLIEVNGQPVTTRAEARAAYDLDKSNVARLVFQQGTAADAPTVNFIWARIPPPFEFDVADDGTLELLGGRTPQDLGLDAAPTVTAINGLPIEDITGPPMDVPATGAETTTFTRISVMTQDGPADIIVQRTMFGAEDWAKYIAGVGLGIIGLFVFWLRPDTRSSAGFLFFCIFCGLMWMVRGIEFWQRNAAENVAYHLLQTQLPLAAAVLLFTFTPLRLLNIHPKRWIAGGAAIGLALMIGNAIADPRHAAYGFLTTNSFRIWAAILLSMLLLALPLNFWMKLAVSS